MALRAITLIAACLTLFMVLVPYAEACFGPKLFVGAGKSLEEKTLFALVTLYVEEKTGVESTYVAIEAGQEPLSLLTADKADLVFISQATEDQTAVFSVGALPVVVTGKRPLEELQFTTVLPAIRKLERLIAAEDLEALIARVDAGESAMAAARSFLMERRWI